MNGTTIGKRNSKVISQSTISEWKKFVKKIKVYMRRRLQQQKFCLPFIIIFLYRVAYRIHFEVHLTTSKAENACVVYNISSCFLPKIYIERYVYLDSPKACRTL